MCIRDRVEGASRKKTPNEIALSTLLISLTIIFLIVIVTLYPIGKYCGVQLLSLIHISEAETRQAALLQMDLQPVLPLEQHQVRDQIDRLLTGGKGKMCIRDSSRRTMPEASGLPA